MLARSLDVGVGFVWTNASEWLMARLNVVVLLCTLRQRASKSSMEWDEWRNGKAIRIPSSAVRRLGGRYMRLGNSEGSGITYIPRNSSYIIIEERRAQKHRFFSQRGTTYRYAYVVFLSNYLDIPFSAVWIIDYVTSLCIRNTEG